MFGITSSTVQSTQGQSFRVHHDQFVSQNSLQLSAHSAIIQVFPGTAGSSSQTWASGIINITGKRLGMFPFTGSVSAAWSHHGSCLFVGYHNAYFALMASTLSPKSTMSVPPRELTAVALDRVRDSTWDAAAHSVLDQEFRFMSPLWRVWTSMYLLMTSSSELKWRRRRRQISSVWKLNMCWHIRVAVKLQPGSEVIGTRGPDWDALMVLSYGQPSVGWEVNFPRSRLINHWIGSSVSLFSAVAVS